MRLHLSPLTLQCHFLVSLLPFALSLLGSSRTHNFTWASVYKTPVGFKVPCPVWSLLFLWSESTAFKGQQLEGHRWKDDDTQTENRSSGVWDHGSSQFDFRHVFWQLTKHSPLLLAFSFYGFVNCHFNQPFLLLLFVLVCCTELDWWCEPCCDFIPFVDHPQNPPSHCGWLSCGFIC